MQVCNIPPKNRCLLLQVISREGSIGEALVALTQCNHPCDHHPVLLNAGIEVLQKLQEPWHHFPDCGSLSFEERWFVPVPSERQAFKLVTPQLLLPVEVLQQVPECLGSDLNGSTKVGHAWGVHKEAQDAPSKICCDPLVCQVQPIQLQAGLFKKGVLPYRTQKPLGGSESLDKLFLVESHVWLPPACIQAVVWQVLLRGFAQKTNTCHIVPPG